MQRDYRTAGFVRLCFEKLLPLMVLNLLFLLTCLPVLVVSYPDARARLPAAADAFLAQWFAGQDHAEPPPETRLRLVPCGTAAEKGLLPGFAVQGISLITEKGVLGLGRSAVVFAPRSFGSTDYEALYGSDFM